MIVLDSLQFNGNHRNQINSKKKENERCEDSRKFMA